MISSPPQGRVNNSSLAYEGYRMDSYLGFIEFFVVALFAMAWAILEWQGRRLDRKRDAERAQDKQE